MTGPTVRVDLDEATKRELQPPCEVRIALALGKLIVIPIEECTDAAEWVVRRICHCGERTIQLVCDRHLKDRSAKWRCSICGCIDQVVVEVPEPLR